MITPVEIIREARESDCGLLVAWTRLRCRRAYWTRHADRRR